MSLELIQDAQKVNNGGRPIVNLGSNSSLRFDTPDETHWLLNLVEGWFRFFSPRPTDIDVETEYVVAGVRGTEFVFHHQKQQCDYDNAMSCSVLWVQEGTVSAKNAKSELLVSGDTPKDRRAVLAFKGRPLVRRSLKITPDDAVNWAIYYPPLVKAKIQGAEVAVAVDERLATTLKMVNSGQIPVAQHYLDSEISKQPSAALYAMRSVLALKHNDKAKALELATRATDLASRESSLGRIYGELRFEKLALLEGAKSIITDPSNHAGHRLLSDGYAAQPRHKIAQVSELLQAQLRRPVNIAPVQPQLAETDLFILNGVGPGLASINEFSSMFNRNGVSVQAGGVVGSHGTVGGELIAFGVDDAASYSVSFFNYQNDGIRENNDQATEIATAFAQLQLSESTSIQTEFRFRNTESGDLELLFDPNFYDLLRRSDQNHSGTRESGMK